MRRVQFEHQQVLGEEDSVQLEGIRTGIQIAIFADVVLSMLALVPSRLTLRIASAPWTAGHRGGRLPS